MDKLLFINANNKITTDAYMEVGGRGMSGAIPENTEKIKP